MTNSVPLISASTKNRLNAMSAQVPPVLMIVGGQPGNHNQVLDWFSAQAFDDRILAEALLLNSPTIEDVRQISNFVRTSSHIERVVRIAEVQAMKVEAQSALLKLLEEPTGKSRYLLSASGLSGVLQTIQSRATIVKLAPPSMDDFEQFAKAHSHEDVLAAYNASAGNVALFSSYLDGQVSNMASAKQIVSSTQYDRLKLVAGMIEDRETAVGTVLAIQSIYRYLVTAKPQNTRQYLMDLELCSRTVAGLRAYGNAKLLLDRLMIGL